uniref:Very-long-chain 3-oxoacyl-CoA reductase n=1 Tax=Chloropicon laureae TaxID=464258 RepID=A0A7S3E5Q6_9CHLO|mmetsp:Transcript_9994/g.25707  ORF Transcript_9994/g.25707 Transcript_9994/m.25707 type:complete len:317 (+) Transcript_9994:105-1055(+)|eukprot:CAMPEP_0197493180 /NCGR_PEP_ID=MMETSP1311-20131121/19846_1 /TAXON_ID=464262 /ORGANISM="Genus nov. species nov., Strain RCC856" /LENGTH=316 /DNA_ID=CAMNT_0043038375 /DNA_START=51 /DNA_END=1001 /DNA_ORIENTATION=+
MDYVTSPEFVATAAKSIATYVLVSRALEMVQFLWRTFLRPGHNLNKKYGGWAVVTGCTDGIGKAFCQELARKKIPLLLISRTESKLQALEAELKEKHGKDYPCKYVVVDFANATEERWEEVREEIEAVDVGMLFNNVGVSYPHAQYLHELEPEVVAQLITVNVECTTRMTKFVLPGMVKRKRGAIINIGSGAATVLPSDPLYSVYAGTKGYVDQFSKSLSVEYAKFNIDVQVQAPLFVVSKMSKIRRASVTVPTPRAYARAGLATIGYETRVSPYWTHNIIWSIIWAMPEGLMDSIRIGMTTNIRKRALAKKNKAK